MWSFLKSQLYVDKLDFIAVFNCTVDQQIVSWLIEREAIFQTTCQSSPFKRNMKKYFFDGIFSGDFCQNLREKIKISIKSFSQNHSELDCKSIGSEPFILSTTNGLRQTTLKAKEIENWSLLISSDGITSYALQNRF